MKVIHYAMLLAHFDGHYGEPSMPSGNFEQCHEITSDNNYNYELK